MPLSTFFTIRLDVIASQEQTVLRRLSSVLGLSQVLHRDSNIETHCDEKNVKQETSPPSSTGDFSQIESKVDVDKLVRKS